MVVLYIIRPVAGELIASRSVVVILGGRKPALDDLSSKMDDGSGVIEVLLIPTCAATGFMQIKLMAIESASFHLQILIMAEHKVSPVIKDLLVFINQGFKKLSYKKYFIVDKKLHYTYHFETIPDDEVIAV